MHNDEHQSSQTGFEVGISETGIKLKADSRAISIGDRWFSNWLRKKSFRTDRSAQTDDQLIKLEAQAVERSGEKLLQRIDSDDEFALQVLSIAYSREERRRDNKEGVILAALEHLKSIPSGSEKVDEGPEKLNDEFLDRAERYAEDASTEELRERWGRVLAAEIREPGTFSNKVLRVIDELESDIARLFENFVASNMGGVVPLYLSGPLSFPQQSSLISAGLIVDPGLGNFRKFSKAPLGNTEFWLLNMGEYAAAFPIAPNIPVSSEENGALIKNGKELSIRVYVLTDAGKAISKLVPNNPLIPFGRYIAGLREYIPQNKLLTFRLHPDRTHWVLIGSEEYLEIWPDE